jgi:hypothetical protein
MAKSKTNIITKGYHGKVGDQFVLKNHGSNSVIAAKPDRANVVLSQAQKDQCRRFTGAVHYAKNALLDPVLKPVYEARATKEKTAFNLAVGDFLTKPWVDQIDATAYSGHVGDKINIIANDNGKITSANVMIRDAGNAELESGACIFDPVLSCWVYTATTVQTPVAGHKILTVVKDLPGHVTEKELVL